jgi:hypothetical protein
MLINIHIYYIINGYYNLYKNLYLEYTDHKFYLNPKLDSIKFCKYVSKYTSFFPSCFL